MKKLVLFAATIVCISVNAKAQFRKLTANEITYYNALYPVLYNAIPHNYKTWKAMAGRTGEFDIRKYWCPDPTPGNDCTGTCPVSVGKGDPYSLDCDIEFTMPGDQSTALKVAAYKTIKDFNNGKQLATALKSTAKAKLKINVISNVTAGDFVLSYCGKNAPEKLDLPVPATLALLGIHSDGCPVMDGGRPSMSPGDKYYDSAVIFLGKPVAKQSTHVSDDGLTETNYAINFDKAKIGTLITQNIVVTLQGDAEDIKAAVKAINWQKLYAAIVK